MEGKNKMIKNVLSVYNRTENFNYDEMNRDICSEICSEVNIEVIGQITYQTHDAVPDNIFNVYTRFWTPIRVATIKQILKR